jgi:hypothetical protein
MRSVDSSTADLLRLALTFSVCPYLNLSKSILAADSDLVNIFGSNAVFLLWNIFVSMSPVLLSPVL